MKLTIYYEDGKVANEIEDTAHVTAELLAILFNKYIAKTTEVKRTHYKYNYNDMQTITFTLQNNVKYVFSNIPTRQSWLDDCKIEYLLKGGKS
jgi:hypothetical protein